MFEEHDMAIAVIINQRLHSLLDLILEIDLASINVLDVDCSHSIKEVYVRAVDFEDLDPLISALVVALGIDIELLE